jgi:hypothetical protein
MVVFTPLKVLDTSSTFILALHPNSFKSLTVLDTSSFSLLNREIDVQSVLEEEECEEEEEPTPCLCPGVQGNDNPGS